MDAFIDTSILIPAIIECPDSDFVRNFISKRSSSKGTHPDYMD